MHRPPNRWFRLHQLRSLAPATPAMWPIDWWTYDSAATVRITGPGQRWRCAAPSRLSCYRERSVPLLSLASLEGDLKCQAKKKTKKLKIVYIAIIYVLLNWGHLLLIMVGRQVNTAAMGTNRLIPAVGHAHSLKVIQSPTRNWARPPRAFLDLTSDGNFAKVSTAAAPGSWTLAEYQRFFWTQTQLQSSHVTWRRSCFSIHSLCPASLLSYIPSFLCNHKDKLVLSKCRPVW